MTDETSTELTGTPADAKRLRRISAFLRVYVVARVDPESSVAQTLTADAAFLRALADSMGDASRRDGGAA